MADGSTLDALLRKIGLLRDALKAPLAGRMMALLDLASRVPWRVWYDADPKGHDTRFWDRLVAAMPIGPHHLSVFNIAGLTRQKAVLTA